MKSLILLILLILIILTFNSVQSQNGWFQQNSGTLAELNDVFFINNSTGWIAADSGLILRTTDAGLSWERQRVSSRGDFLSIHFINEDTGWASGGEDYILPSNFLYKTTNGGVVWSALLSIGGSIFPEVYFLNATTGFMTSDNSGPYVSSGSLGRTSNGGTNWSGSYSSDFIFDDITFLNENTGWASGYSWTDYGADSLAVLRTTNAGVNWIAKYKKYDFIPSTNISAKGDNVWVVGGDSVVLHSSDSGINWQTQHTPIVNWLTSIFFINELTGWAGGYRYPDTTNLIKTTNGGAEWFKLRNQDSYWINSIHFVDPNTGWSVCNNGIILKTITGGLTSYSENEEEIVSSFILHQNYPNPFNPKTIIKYSIDRNTNAQLSEVKITLYDLIGKKIVDLVNEKKANGIFEIEFDATSYSSGVYFYELIVNGKSIDVKRMVILK